MDKNDLKSMWHDAHYTKSENSFSEESLERTMAIKHSKSISKSLLDVKLKFLFYTLIFLIYIGLLIYAFVYLRMNLSVSSLIPLVLAGTFLLLSASAELVRLFVLTRTADNLSLKDSLLAFAKKLKRIKTTDFIILLVFFYSSAFLIIYNYLSDIGGLTNLWQDNETLPLPLFGILIVMLLSVPWFFRYLNNRRYKELYSNLMDSLHEFNDRPDPIGE
jgi:hypothetical protein